jgi:hypothetical protein
MAGDGVLKRSLCHNEEELLSGEEKEKLDPLLYFSFKENGKIWWFDIRSIISCMNESLKPLNPYTREPLTIETRKRVRYFYNLRLRTKLDVTYQPDEKYTNSIITEKRWIRICQILEENAFEDVTPNIFDTMNKTEFYVFLFLLVNDMKGWIAGPKNMRKLKYLFCVRNLLAKKQFITTSADFSYCVSGLLLSLLNDCTDPYPLCFMIMSALYRL